MVATDADSPLTNENTNRSDSRKQWGAPQALATLATTPGAKRAHPTRRWQQLGRCGSFPAIAVVFAVKGGWQVKEGEQVAVLVHTVEQVSMWNVIDGVPVPAHEEIPHRILAGRF